MELIKKKKKKKNREKAGDEIYKGIFLSETMSTLIYRKDVYETQGFFLKEFSVGKNMCKL